MVFCVNYGNIFLPILSMITHVNSRRPIIPGPVSQEEFNKINPNHLVIRQIKNLEEDWDTWLLNSGIPFTKDFLLRYSFEEEEYAVTFKLYAGDVVPELVYKFIKMNPVILPIKQVPRYEI